MKVLTIKKAHDIIQQDSPKANTLIAICDADDNVTVSFAGKPSMTGKALYAALFDTEHPEAAQDIYNMLKDIILNILMNPSPIADDLIATLRQIRDEMERHSCKTIPLIPQGEA